MNNSKVANEMLKKLSSTPVRFKDAVTEIIFMAKPVVIFSGEYEFNQRLHDEETVTLDDYCGLLGIVDPSDISFEFAETARTCGWGLGCILEQGYNWLEFEHTYDGDHDFFVINPKIQPCAGFCNCYLTCHKSENPDVCLLL